MSIDRTQQITATSLPELHQEMTKRTDKSSAQHASSSSHARACTRVSLSNQVSDLQSDTTQDINYTRLESIKSALAAGELPIDTDKISQSLVQEMFQLS